MLGFEPSDERSSRSHPTSFGDTMKLLLLLLILFAGGLLTSYFEYKFDYNLYDLLKDKFLSKK
jgi:hypothetical protein